VKNRINITNSLLCQLANLILTTKAHKELDYQNKTFAGLREILSVPLWLITFETTSFPKKNINYDQIITKTDLDF